MGAAQDPIVEAQADLDALGADASSSDVAAALAGLGVALMDAGQAREAVAVLEQSMSMSMRLSDPEALSDTMGVLGRALTEDRRYAEARDVLTTVVAQRSSLLGPDDPQTLVARGNLLRAVRLGGQPEESLRLARALLADRLRILGPDHPSTLDSRGHVAQSLLEANEAPDAVRELEELIVDRVRVLGPDHIDVLSTRHNLAAARSRVPGADPESVMAALVDNLSMIEERLGPEDPFTFMALGFVAEQAQRSGEYELAISTLDALVEERTRVLGASAAATLTSRRMLAATLLASGDPERAMHVVDPAAVEAAMVYGPAAIETLQLPLELARVLQAELDDGGVDVDGGVDIDARLLGVLASLSAVDLSFLESGDPLRAQIESVLASSADPLGRGGLDGLDG